MLHAILEKKFTEAQQKFDTAQALDDQQEMDRQSLRMDILTDLADNLPDDHMSLEMMNTDQVAHALQCSTEHVRRLIRRGDLKAVRLGRTSRVKTEWLDAYIEGLGAA